ncbi:MAG: iron ABC transporter permease [Candidatus Tectomicrobia bacterium]|uniref:Iron ABC transporter permease n=1 Tax=Tectimicrobiota bacterium TaxID=2528274 RepID=A0A938B4G9_UNCTE|nr:iron ABC transporter permease [Candidatus Tectomicrobia bacterium]
MPVLSGLGLLLLLSLFIGVSLGTLPVAPGTVATVLAANLLPAGWIDVSAISEADRVVVWLIRTPRVLVAALVGMGLALAGAQLQGLLHNPLASPDLIGTSAGGAFGAVLAIACGLAARSLWYLPLLAFLSAMGALCVVYAIATQRGRTPVATLLLSGVALNALLGAGTSLVLSLQASNYQVAQEIIFWLMGGLDSRTWIHVGMVAPCVLLGALIAATVVRELDVLLLGEEAAASLGVHIEHVKRTVLTSAALLTGAAVAVSGVLSFVGLVVPHMVRLVLGPAHRRVLPASALAGASLVILADVLARTIMRPEELRLGIITATFGAPFFLYLLLTRKREIGLG